MALQALLTIPVHRRSRLALVCCADVVKIHNTKAGGVVGILKGHDRSVTGVCTVAGDRNQVLTSSLDGTCECFL